MIDKKTVEYVAELARINISEEEKAKLLPQLSKILDYIDKLKEIDTKDVEPTRGYLLETNILRKDEVVKFPFSKDILNNAPSHEEGHLKIPKVIE